MTPHFVVGLVLTGLVGVSLGLLGAGGSIIMLPVLVYVVGVPVREAVPLSLAIVGTTSLLSAMGRSRQGSIRWRSGLLFGSVALVGAYFGSRLTYLVPATVLVLCFGALLIIVGLHMLKETTSAASRSTGEPRWPVMVPAGSFVGALTGFFGVGGGFLIVPALVKTGGLDVRTAISTSLVVIAMSSAAGLAAHVAHGTRVSMALVLPLTLAAVIGMVAGMQGARHVSGRHLQRTFAVFVTVVGSALTILNAAAVCRTLGGE